MRISDWSSDVCSSDLAARVTCGKVRGRCECSCFVLIESVCPTPERTGSVIPHQDALPGRADPAGREETPLLGLRAPTLRRRAGSLPRCAPPDSGDSATAGPGDRWRLCG